MKKLLIIAVLALVFTGFTSPVAERWSVQKANEWYASQPWPVGCVYMPSYGGTPVEIWGKEYFKPEVVDSELALAEDLGFNAIRLFLCDVVWQEDPEGFLERLEETARLADKHGLRILMTFFTNGGTIKNPYTGPQPQPVPGVHNSVWMSSPGKEVVNNPERWPVIERYLKQVMMRYKNDPRILAWCLYNEPENTKGFETLPFLTAVYRWAREVNPSQPLTSPMCAMPDARSYNKPISDFICANSDIISFHCYDDIDRCRKFVDYALQFGRPVLCSEWMARTRGSDYPSILPLFKEKKIACFSYGLVNGKQQCQYPWNPVVDGKPVPFTEEPDVWFHDLFRSDHTPYREEEIRFIKDCLGVTNKSRMDRSRLNIGTYTLQPYARSEAHIRDLAKCGIDFVIGMNNDRETLDLFSKYGVGAVVSGVVPGWWGGNGDNAGQMAATHPLSEYEERAAGFVDHPAIWGIDIGDEPSALDFPHYGKVAAKVEQLFPKQFAYLNLYPNYASVAKNTEDQTINQLGTTSYREHIAAYCRNVPMDYLCYDFYVYSSRLPLMYDNLKIVSDACTGTSRSMWIVLQVNSLNPEEWVSLNQLRFQAWTAMAFGAEVITWACYTAGWWHNQVLDEKGEKTQQYEKLKKMNAEIHRLAEPYMNYRRVASSFVGFDGTPWLEGVSQRSEPSFNNGVVSGLQANDGSPLVVGDMVSRSGDGSRALFVTSADDPYDKEPKAHTLLFQADGCNVKASGPSGEVKLEQVASGWYTCPLASNEAVLIELF